MENFAAVFPKLAYQIYFAKKTKDAAEELDKDARKTLRAVYRSVATKPPTKFLKSRDDFLEAYAQVGLDDRIPYLSQIEEDYLVKVYGVQGFKNSQPFVLASSIDLLCLIPFSAVVLHRWREIPFVGICVQPRQPHDPTTSAIHPAICGKTIQHFATLKHSSCTTGFSGGLGSSFRNRRFGQVYTPT